MNAVRRHRYTGWVSDAAIFTEWTEGVIDGFYELFVSMREKPPYVMDVLNELSIRRRLLPQIERKVGFSMEEICGEKEKDKYGASAAKRDGDLEHAVDMMERRLYPDISKKQYLLGFLSVPPNDWGRYGRWNWNSRSSSKTKNWLRGKWVRVTAIDWTLEQIMKPVEKFWEKTQPEILSRRLKERYPGFDFYIGDEKKDVEEELDRQYEQYKSDLIEWVGGVVGDAKRVDLVSGLDRGALTNKQRYRVDDKKEFEVEFTFNDDPRYYNGPLEYILHREVEVDEGVDLVAALKEASK